MNPMNRNACQHDIRGHMDHAYKLSFLLSVRILAAPTLCPSSVPRCETDERAGLTSRCVNSRSGLILQKCRSLLLLS